MATSAELKQNILNGGYDQAFAKLYGADTATVAAQRVRYVDMIDHWHGPHSVFVLGTRPHRDRRQPYRP